jgi:hypothetical protein
MNENSHLHSIVSCKVFSNNLRAQIFKLEYSFHHKIITNTRKHLAMFNILEKNISVRKDHINSNIKENGLVTLDAVCLYHFSL